jgi:hypothetical protein
VAEEELAQEPGHKGGQARLQIVGLLPSQIAINIVLQQKKEERNIQIPTGIVALRISGGRPSSKNK